MAGRFHPGRLIRRVGAVMALVALTACAIPGDDGPQGTPGADPSLVSQADIMSRTILEAAMIGGLAGGLGTVTLGDPDRIGIGISVGTTVGVVSGTYVGFLQTTYARQEEYLARVQQDLDRNSAEIAATISVMRNVLAVQQADLAALRAGAAAGTVTEAQVATEVAAAQANLTEMSRAIDGAQTRQAELASARPLAGPAIDSDLTALARQIQEMSAIAEDLADAI